MKVKLQAALVLLSFFAVRIIALPQVMRQTPIDFSPLPPSKSTVQLELGPRLSKGASLYFPNSSDFADYTERWSTSTESDFAVVVVPAMNRDVAETVKSWLFCAGYAYLIASPGQIRECFSCTIPRG